MQNLRAVVLAFMFTCIILTPFALRQEKAEHPPKRHFVTTLAQDRKTEADLVQLLDNIKLVKAVQYLNTVKQLQAISEKQKAAEEAKEHQDARASSKPPTASGDCYDMAPPGFPSYIIQRESNNTTTADNGSHYGCVQLDYSYLTGDYAADWARLWDDGRGACHWNPPNYCA